MRKVIKILILVLILGIGFLVFKNNMKDPRVDFSENTQKLVETEDKGMDDDPVLIVEKMMGNLEDVSGGTAGGKVVAGYENGEYRLSASFENLPELEPGYFYEGWIVRQGADFSVLSTGKTTYEENIFTSETDLTDHDFYVLTLEPDDGDPAPAGHILEGKLGY